MAAEIGDSPAKKRATVPSFAFIGPFAVGKTTYSDRLAELFEKELGVKAYRPSFSAKMEDIARDLFDMEEYDRSLMQAIANKMREIDPAIWAKYIIKDVMKNGRLPIITDGIRKQEELATVKNEIPDLVVVKLHAEDEKLLAAYRKKFGREPTKEQQNNPAEQHIESLRADMVLENDYTQETIDMQLRQIIRAIKDDTLKEMMTL
jgi:dephospho-CoA kinase